MLLSDVAARMAGAFTRAMSPEAPQYPLSEQTLAGWLLGPASAAGVHVNERSALHTPAVYRAILTIASGCAALPIHAYRTTDDQRVPTSKASASARMLGSPHPDLTPFELWELLFGHLVSWGNSYSLKVRAGGLGVVTGLWPIMPDRVRVGRAADGTKIFAVDGGADPAHVFTEREIFHVPAFGYDGVVGLSPIGLARNGIGLAQAAELYGAKLFESGALSSGILQTDQRLDDDQATKLKKRWQETSGGLQNAHAITVLGSGAKFQPISIPPEDAQFLQTRQFQISEIARLFGVPPHMLMDTQKSTSWGTGIEQQTLGFVTYTLRPWLVRMEQRLSALVSPADVYVRFSTEGLLRGDSAARSTFYRAMWELGVFSTNDIRALEDLPPVDGGDLRYRPLNMGELGKTDPQPAGTPPAPPTGTTNGASADA